MAQNISTYEHIKTIVSSFYLHFNSQWRYAVFLGRFVGQSDVWRLIKVFVVTDLPIHAFFTTCLGLPKFMQFAVYICIEYIYIYNWDDNVYNESKSAWYHVEQSLNVVWFCLSMWLLLRVSRVDVIFRQLKQCWFIVSFFSVHWRHGLQGLDDSSLLSSYGLSLRWEICFSVCILRWSLIFCWSEINKSGQ